MTTAHHHLHGYTLVDGVDDSGVFWDTLAAPVQGVGYQRRPAFAGVHLSVSAGAPTSITFEAVSNMVSNAVDSHLVVLVDGVAQAKVPIATALNPQAFSIVLDGAAHTIEIMEGTRVTPTQGVWLRRVLADPNRVTIVQPTPPATRVVLDHNSIGAACSVTTEPALNRFSRPWVTGTTRVTCVGCSGRKILDDAGAEPALAASHCTGFDGTVRNIYARILGVNDAIANNDAGAVQTSVTATFNAVHALRPDVELVAITHFLQAYDPTHDAAIRAAVSAGALAAGASVIDGTAAPLVQWTDWAGDRLHPNDSGHAKIAVWLAAQLGLGA